MATAPNFQQPSAAPASTQQLSPVNFFKAINAFHLTAALKAAIELNVFTAISSGAHDPASIALYCKTAERGARILCDYLTIHGFLTKDNGRYELTPESTAFLSKSSKMYLGDAIHFLTGEKQTDAFARLTDAVRKGGSALESPATEAESSMWISFARDMAPMMYPLAQAVAHMLPLPFDRTTKVLDIAASHGLYGISIAQRFHHANIVALDWKNVLEVTTENAQRFGISDRFSTIAGDAFQVDFGNDYDAIVLTNLLHHFDETTCTDLLEKCHRALRPGGIVAIVEFIPNEDRVTPPDVASFSLTMLAGTPHGDAYTHSQLAAMLDKSGFHNQWSKPLPNNLHTLVVASK